MIFSLHHQILHKFPISVSRRVNEWIFSICHSRFSTFFDKIFAKIIPPILIFLQQLKNAVINNSSTSYLFPFSQFSHFQRDYLGLTNGVKFYFYENEQLMIRIFKFWNFTPSFQSGNEEHKPLHEKFVNWKISINQKCHHIIVILQSKLEWNNKFWVYCYSVI